MRSRFGREEPGVALAGDGLATGVAGPAVPRFRFGVAFALAADLGLGFGVDLVLGAGFGSSEPLALRVGNAASCSTSSGTFQYSVGGRCVRFGRS